MNSQNQMEGNGATPISPLQLIVSPCEVRDVRSFVEQHHYSKSINGVKIRQAFRVTANGELVGAVLFGACATTAWKAYGQTELDVCELRRLVLLDNCGKNSESRVIGFCLRWLKKHTEIKTIISYADPYHDHEGIIYKATGFEYRGQTSKDTLLQTPEGRLFHSRALRTRYNGEYKPFVKRLREMDEAGLLTKIVVPGKHIYVKSLTGD